MKEFSLALKRKGKKMKVIARNIDSLNLFTGFLEKEKNKPLTQVTKSDILDYIKKIETEKKSAKGILYVLMNYFKFLNNENLFQFTRELREVRTSQTRRIFPLNGFLDIKTDYVDKLAQIGIRNVEQMLKAGKTKNQRAELAKKYDIPEKAILELVKLSDLTRIGYIKTKLTRLYYNSGLDSPRKIACFKADELHDFFVDYIKKSNWNGMIPNLKDLKNNIASAKKLSEFVEY